MRQFIFGTILGGPLIAHAGLFILRAFAGLSLALAHGRGKLPPPQMLIDGVGKLGFPAPTFFAWCVAAAEFGGGLLLALGLLTRPAAALIVINMAVAAFGAHAQDPYQVKELALLYGAIALCFLLAGSGRLGIDALIAPKQPEIPPRGFEVAESR